jgi:hypothetical protein
VKIHFFSLGLTLVGRKILSLEPVYAKLWVQKMQYCVFNFYPLAEYMQNRDCTCSSILIGSYNESLLQRQIILRFCLTEETFFSSGLTLVGRKIPVMVDAHGIHIFGLTLISSFNDPKQGPLDNALHVPLAVFECVTSMHLPPISRPLSHCTKTLTG